MEDTGGPLPVKLASGAIIHKTISHERGYIHIHYREEYHVNQ